MHVLGGGEGREGKGGPVLLYPKRGAVVLVTTSVGVSGKPHLGDTPKNGRTADSDARGIVLPASVILPSSVLSLFF